MEIQTENWRIHAKFSVETKKKLTNIVVKCGYVYFLPHCARWFLRCPSNAFWYFHETKKFKWFLCSELVANIYTFPLCVLCVLWGDAFFRSDKSVNAQSHELVCLFSNIFLVHINTKCTIHYYWLRSSTSLLLPHSRPFFAFYSHSFTLHVFIFFTGMRHVCMCKYKLNGIHPFGGCQKAPCAHRINHP